jgi:hypothetical protein
MKRLAHLKTWWCKYELELEIKKHARVSSRPQQAVRDDVKPVSSYVRINGDCGAGRGGFSQT